VAWLYQDEEESGTWTTDLHYNPLKTFAHRKIPIDSRGELECRRVLEKIFKAPFPNCRPAFLYSQITGQPSEIDCYNETLKLGCEYNGRQHYAFVKQFHKNYEAFKNQQYRDVIKLRACEDRGVKIISVPYTVKHQDIEAYIVNELVKMGYLNNT
jgi:hypothetical protein